MSTSVWMMYVMLMQTALIQTVVMNVDVKLVTLEMELPVLVG
ncbi:hypothetical protein SPBRAN_869 [uncultured Candidatus Thioglobus sp.]|nr:hypothetical protein SPBRAN_869 [uncultured Candidatus Thioglobus sp.]